MNKEVKTGPCSKATAAQREHHKRRCQAAGEWRRKQNFVWGICEAARKININGLEFLQLCYLLYKNGKFPIEGPQWSTMINLLEKKLPAAKVYQEMFGCQA